MDPIQLLLLVLLAAVVIFGFGVLILNRRRTMSASTKRPVEQGSHNRSGSPSSGAQGTATLDRRGPVDGEVLDGEAVAEDVVVEEVVVEEVVVEEIVVDEVVESPTPKRSFRDRLSKARSAFSGAFSSILGRSSIDAETWDDLEIALLSADVGVSVADELIGGLKSKVESKEIEDPAQLLAGLKAEMISRLDGTNRELRFDDTLGEGHPNVWMFVGVNGVGKTTTIGKLARQQRDDGRTILLAAGDTFRAAAAEQLGTWAERADAEFVRGAEGGDPSSVIFDGVERAGARKIDIVFADTAGRLHNKTNLMDELSKVRRVAEKGAGTVTETLLVIDATTGQNGLTQAEVFAEVTDVTGVVLTKLDGSAKGGIVFAIETKLGIPVKLVGVGEQIGDLVPFVPSEFVNALFDDDAGDGGAPHEA